MKPGLWLLLVLVAGLFGWALLLSLDGLRQLLQRKRQQHRLRLAGTPLTLRIRERIDHTGELFTLVLAADDGRRLPPSLPGQYLSVLQGDSAGGARRRYSLSSWQARPREYRLGIRRLQDGKVSCWLHQRAQTGCELQVLPPAGSFVLTSGLDECVLLAGGIGITPLAAMLQAMASGAFRARRVWLFHAARHADELLGYREFHELQKQHPWFHYRPWLSQPDADWPGRRGRIGVADLLGELQRPQRAQFYLCAGSAMMQQLADELQQHGIAASAIHYEAFGNAGNNDAGSYRVEVEGYGDHTFHGQPSLLHALEDWGIPIEADCRAGECGACRIGLQAGQLRQLLPHPAENNTLLACCCAPASDLKITLGRITRQRRA